jgi:hypothetical protein
MVVEEGLTRIWPRWTMQRQIGGRVGRGEGVVLSCRVKREAGKENSECLDVYRFL